MKTRQILPTTDIFNISALALLLQTYWTSNKQEFNLSGKDCVICEQILNINLVSLRNFRLNTCKRKHTFVEKYIYFLTV